MRFPGLLHHHPAQRIRQFRWVVPLIRHDPMVAATREARVKGAWVIIIAIPVYCARTNSKCPQTDALQARSRRPCCA